MNQIKRADIRSGMSVAIVLKEDQASGKLTDGIVRDILTKSPLHPHGIKVRLMSREVGRVKKIY
ncbi:YwbE family protein [Sulfurimonas sp.]|uniref:YwbE family protein n=1 Tax=Sulfurimonas sp. TaxID=2022749 RepID=UPI0019FD594C|nr:YwbE family protein [Sulfurimonas sp.]MBE0513999.1 YwbE family protein [Sulfurimonas sp.]MDT8338206.1 YwbE family protein [Sulfurimonas sp.]